MQMCFEPLTIKLISRWILTYPTGVTHYLFTSSELMTQESLIKSNDNG